MLPAVLLLAAANHPVVKTIPFREPAVAYQLMSDALLDEPTDIDVYCGEMTLHIDMVVRPAGRVDKLDIEGPTCATGRIDALRKALLHAPPAAFIPVERTTRYRFKMQFKLPANAQ